MQDLHIRLILWAVIIVGTILVFWWFSRKKE